MIKTNDSNTPAAPMRCICLSITEVIQLAVAEKEIMMMIKELLVKLIPFTGVEESVAHGIHAMCIWLLSTALAAAVMFTIGLILFAAFNHILNEKAGNNKAARKFWRRVKNSMFS